MADLPSHPDSDDGTGAGSDCGPMMSTPRRMPVLGVAIALVVVALIVVLHVTGAIGPASH